MKVSIIACEHNSLTVFTEGLWLNSVHKGICGGGKVYMYLVVDYFSYC